MPTTHVFTFCCLVLCCMGFMALLIVVAFKARDAIYYYNMYRRQKGLDELSMGYFDANSSTSRVLFCALPDDMSRTIKGFIWSYRFWTIVFFANMGCIAVLAGRI